MADGNEFLSLTQQLALSSAFGAVQCSFGPCSSVQHAGAAEDAGATSAGGARLPPDQQQRPDMVLLVRFQDGDQLQAFLDCPPVAALLQVGPGGPHSRGALRAEVASVVCTILALC